MSLSSSGWIGVDLDGTLAYYDTWRGPTHIGEPVPLMVERVKQWLWDGKDVRIFTARANTLDPLELTQVLTAIMDWCLVHIGVPLVVTCEKDMHMIELWDDRCVQVQQNTGELMVDVACRNL
jgi:hypothetical protein